MLPTPSMWCRQRHIIATQTGRRSNRRQRSIQRRTRSPEPEPDPPALRRRAPAASPACRVAGLPRRRACRVAGLPRRRPAASPRLPRRRACRRRRRLPRRLRLPQRTRFRAGFLFAPPPLKGATRDFPVARTLSPPRRLPLRPPPPPTRRPSVDARAASWQDRRRRPIVPPRRQRARQLQADDPFLHQTPFLPRRGGSGRGGGR
jgi:hypothetical protein